jgi:hypothetical protein
MLQNGKAFMLFKTKKLQKFWNVFRIRKEFGKHWFNIFGNSGSISEHCRHNNGAHWHEKLVTGIQ